MRKLIINLLITAIYLLNKNQKSIDDSSKKLCNIVANDRYLQLTMPNGEIIPGQLDLQINQPLKLRGMAVVKCTFRVRFDNLIK